MEKRKKFTKNKRKIIEKISTVYLKIFSMEQVLIVMMSGIYKFLEKNKEE